ncbi:uncharacterized protein LOC104583893 [Brachypodium distachyon]|uniref:Uncharacterized protein n=1 Tax=Brachypodium distachyon TaxID=15368 RepID=A0A0Q3MD38_BRADI|nr:uncharacterized protein LOC104583893 [Brachypodium distachyon]KQK02222.1 hypothetical protein BRADI_3g61112v3 [Brachypodium distachyon]|eukprot:XP_010236204.2 uncharacterized protein LOC104583893 [Brachypodium distachyon]
MEDVDDVDDLERSLLASTVLAFAAVRAERASQLVDLARQTAAAAAEVDPPASGHLTESADSMARAVMALSVADAYTRPRAAVELGACAAKLSMAAREVNIELADAAYDLARESEDLTRMAADLKATMLGFARQQNRGLLGQIAAFCTSRVRPSSVRSFAEGGTSVMQPLGLGMSLRLFPYMGRQGILSSDNFSDNELWLFNIIFCSWWILVSLGVAASLCPETRLLMEYARLSSHLSMLGITILVILYGYVMLAPDAWIAVLIFLAVSCFFHVLFYLQSCHRSGM